MRPRSIVRLFVNPGRLVLAVALACAGMGPGLSRANTLDPHHPVWDRTDLDPSSWHRALDAAREEARVRPRAFDRENGALLRGAAFGRRILVIPVLPRDATAAPVSRAQLEERWFGPGENSVRGYWSQVSGGRLELDGQVLPWVDVSGTVETDYLNVLDGNPVVNILAGPRALARDGLAAAARVLDDLGPYDDDGPDGAPGSGDDDGVLDLVVILHPREGWEISTPTEGRAIVSLQARLSDQAESIAGTDYRADTFVIGSATAPLGVWVHEFGHLLGLDDLYDFDQSVLPGTVGSEARLGGLGRWSLMASGTWADGGARPSGLDPWSRRRLGFGTPRVIDADAFVRLEPVSLESTDWLELRPRGEWGGERFLLEVRRPREGAVVDGALPGGGILVYRVTDEVGPIDGTRRWIELLQADGRDDLAALTGGNEGDAGDPFTGAPGSQRIDGQSNPSTQSATASASRIPPVLEFAAAGADGAHDLNVFLEAGAALQLVRARFAENETETRTYLQAREDALWDLAFEDVGEEAITGAAVRASLTNSARPGSLSTLEAVPLEARDGVWALADTLRLIDTSDFDDRRPLLVDLHLTVNGGPERSIALGVPVGFFPGLDPDVGLFDFVPEVLSSGTEVTEFVSLAIGELPNDASVGFGLRTAGQRRYAESVHVALLGPWISIPLQRSLSFSSRHRTESAGPGLAWDGGLVEVFVPDRGWRALQPDGPGVAQIVRQSQAAVRDRLGVGGESPIWQRYTAMLPDVDLPTRLRVRFASDEFDGGTGWWELAGLGVGADPARAELRVRERASGGLEVVAELEGDFARFDVVRLRYRPLGSQDWLEASDLISPTPGVASILRLVVPEEFLVFEVGLFAESASAAFAPVLLGRAGYQRSASLVLPRLMQNPARGRLVLQVPRRDEPTALAIHDIRGRRATTLTIPAQSHWFEWDGRTTSGSRLASGVYFYSIVGAPERARRFVFVK